MTNTELYEKYKPEGFDTRNLYVNKKAMTLIHKRLDDYLNDPIHNIQDIFNKSDSFWTSVQEEIINLSLEFYTVEDHIFLSKVTLATTIQSAVQKIIAEQILLRYLK